MPVPELPLITQRTSADQPPAILNKLIDLAQFEIAPERLAYFETQLNRQREALVKLDEAIDMIEAENLPVELMTHGVMYTRAILPELRADLPHEAHLAKDILNHAPKTDGECFLVPPPKHEKLESVS